MCLDSSGMKTSVKAAFRGSTSHPSARVLHRSLKWPRHTHPDQIKLCPSLMSHGFDFSVLPLEQSAVGFSRPRVRDLTEIFKARRMGKRCVLITGCSSGIGRALCYALHSKIDQKGEKRFQVFATARRIESLKQLAEDGISTVSLDVCSQASISACMAEVTKQAGAIDVLINNAGMQATGPLVEQPLEYFQQVMDTNVTGPVRMTQAAVPAMLARGSGLVVNICSVSSYIDLPLSAVYCASKAALLSLTNCLRMEVQPLGVHVLAVTAGVIESEIGKKNKCDFERYYGSGSAYHSIADAIQKRMDVPAKERPLMTAEAAAEKIAAAIMKKNPPRELVTGGKARLALLGGFVQKWVYPSFVERKFMKMFGLQGLKPVPPVDSSSFSH